MEFSKKIFVGVTIGTVVVTIFTLALAWRTQDTSVLAYLIPAVFAELATATGFYFRKAEKENTKGGIVYDSAMADRKAEENCNNDNGAG